ncbi:trace amine-associated receptor 9-like [Diadema antillarum]|uniref:trace amine-associated receptor 9-like n=1 Tax=Diadema antillarum TaxID=105358 RepID=UPI003A83AB50
MSILGIVGNLIVILVIFQRRNICRSTDALIGALAVADFFTSVFMVPLPTPLRVPGTWLGDFYCKVVYSEMLRWISVDASIFILALIPIERYIAIAQPLHFKRLVTRQRVNKAVAVTWLVAFLANIFEFFVAGAKGDMCTEVFHSQLAQIVTGCMLFLVQFLIPAFIMLLAQALTALVLHRQSRRSLGEDSSCHKSNPSAKYLVARKRVLKILFLVVAVFFISWTPTQTAYLLKRKAKMGIMATIVLIISGTIHPAVTAQPTNTTEHSPPTTLGVSAVNSGNHSDIVATDGMGVSYMDMGDDSANSNVHAGNSGKSDRDPGVIPKAPHLPVD